MKVRRFVTPGPTLLITLIAALALITLVAACDGGSSSGGCDSGPGPNPGEPVIDTQTMVPHSSWTCGMAQGIPAPENGELVFEISFNLGEIYDMGQTQYGHRHLIEIDGGSVNGPDIRGNVVTGGLDWQLTLSNGAMEIDEAMVLRTSDGEYIYFRNCGAAADAGDVRVVPDFEAPNSGDYAWLNNGKFAGVRKLNTAAKTMTMSIYDVSNVTIQPNAANAIHVTQPAGVLDQDWECREASASERQGAELYTEVVNIGGSLSVGQSKNGNRNIVPITGGRATGDISGTVLAGGADFQIISGLLNMYLDARYTIRTREGELIIVRNCGPASSLVPVFETRNDGPYAYLNDQLWLSSSPGIRLGAVELTIYQSR